MSLWDRMMKKRGKGKTGKGGGGTPTKPVNGDEFTDAELDAMSYGYMKHAPGRMEEIEKLRKEQKNK